MTKRKYRNPFHFSMLPELNINKLLYFSRPQNSKYLRGGDHPSLPIYEIAIHSFLRNAGSPRVRKRSGRLKGWELLMSGLERTFQPRGPAIMVNEVFLGIDHCIHCHPSNSLVHPSTVSKHRQTLYWGWQERDSITQTHLQVVRQGINPIDLFHALAQR